MITYNESGVTYDEPLQLYGGAVQGDFFRRAEYSVVLRDFVDAANGDFRPGDVIAFIDNPYFLAWTEYVNEVGEAFFSLSQDDPKAVLLADLADLVNRRVHMQIYRNGTIVWGGWLGEIDETSNDVVFYGYSYLSGFYDLLTEWNQEWDGKEVTFIFRDLFDDARNKESSRVHWFSRGTTETLVTTSGGSTALELPKYRASFKRILTAWKELAAYAISDTTNHVIFEITPTGRFNLFKNRKSSVNNVKASFGHGYVRSFRRIRRPVHRRSVVYGVGSSPTDVNLQTTQESATLLAQMGRSEEPLYFSFVRDATELSRVTLLRKNRAIRVDAELFVSFYRDRIVPFRASSNPDYKLGDLIQVELDHGSASITEEKVVLGQQVVYHRKSENVRLLLGDRL